MNQCWNNEGPAAVVTKKGEPLGQKNRKVSVSGNEVAL